MDEAARYSELASQLEAEKQKVIGNISTASVQKGAGLGGPNGAVGVYNTDRYVRPTVEPLVAGLTTKAKQIALQETINELAKQASSRYQTAAANYSRRMAAAAAARSSGSGGSSEALQTSGAPQTSGVVGKGEAPKKDNSTEGVGIPRIPLVYNGEVIDNVQQNLANRGAGLTKIGNAVQYTPVDFSREAFQNSVFGAQLYGNK